MIEIQPVAAYHGPSLVAMDPVVVVELRSDGAGPDGWAAAIAALQSASADWYQPPESTVAPGVGEFLADWALQALTFVNGYLHDAGGVTDPGTGRALVWVGFHDPQLSLAALELGARWLTALIEGRPDAEDWEALRDELWANCRRKHPDTQARIVMEAARARGVPYSPAWGSVLLWRFGHGSRSRVLFEASSCDDSRVGSWIANCKARTKWTLRSLGIPTPAFRLVERDDEVEAAVDDIGFPCVTKPIDQGLGRGVACGLGDLAAVREGVATAREHTSGPVMVEAHVEGEDHRLMVVDGRMVAVLRRVPPSVTGDGRRTIAELVAEKNLGRDPRSPVRSRYACPIVMDASAVLHLAGLGLDPQTVLADGRTVRVRSNANLSTGGDCVDVTGDVHPDIRAMAETVAVTLKLAMLAVDYLTTDIGQGPAVSGGQFNEINTTPALDVMVEAGWSVERAGGLALGDATGRIPVHVVVVAEEDLASALNTMRAQPRSPGLGWACWGHADAGMELQVEAGPAWPGVQTLLAHRTIDRAVLIATAQQIYEYGLPLRVFDSAHVTCELDPRWLALLRQCSTGPVHDDRAGDVAAALTGLAVSLGSS